MRKAKRSNGFLLCLLLNLILNFEWSIPAWIVLILHFTLGLSLWWFVLGLAIWIVPVLAMSLLLAFASGVETDFDKPRENKNPYSNRDEHS